MRKTKDQAKEINPLLKAKKDRSLQLRRILELLRNSKQKTLLEKITSYIDPDCQICQSNYRQEIDELLLDDTPYRKMSEKILKKFGIKNLNIKYIGDHFNDHLEQPILDGVKAHFEGLEKRYIDAFEELGNVNQIWNDTVEVLQESISKCDYETIHTKVAVLNQLLKTKLLIVELSGKLDGTVKTNKKVTPSAIGDIIAETMKKVGKAQ